MRLGAAWEKNNNAYYRAVYPLQAMAERGHEVVWQSDRETEAHLGRLADCDVVHVYRSANDVVLRILAQLARAGVAITYDNDDDFTAVPKESPLYKSTGALEGQRIFGKTLKAARMAYGFTTPSQVLADKYREAGVERVEVLPNSLSPAVARPRYRHDGIVIGWIAGVEHRADVNRLQLTEVLTRLLAEHEDARVECIGVDLGLPERYRHDDHVLFPHLPDRIGGFDVGIAPLSDIPYNRTRSDIKVKEYAASGVPWLASPVGPYAGLGEEQGGRLVSDDRWFEELEALVTSARRRRRLARKAQRWAAGQTIEAVADRWESHFAAAAAAGGVPASRKAS